MILVLRKMKLIPLFSLLFCAFGLLAAPVTALADSVQIEAVPAFGYGLTVEESLEDLEVMRVYNFETSEYEETSSVLTSSSATLTGSSTVTTVPPQWSVSLVSDIHGLWIAEKQSDGDYNIYPSSALSGPIWDYDGTLSATRNEVSSGSFSGSLSGSSSSDGSVSGTGSSSSTSRYVVYMPPGINGNGWYSFVFASSSSSTMVSANQPFAVFSPYANVELSTELDGSYALLTAYGYHIMGQTLSGSWVEASRDASSGYFYFTENVKQVAITSNFAYVSGTYPYIRLRSLPSLLVVDATISDLIHTVEETTQQQTDTLMNTDGSDSIVSGATSGGEQGLLDKLGFIGTVVQVPLSILDGLTSAEESTITFPGISVPLPGGNFVIPMTEIDLWENFPALETPVRTGCTFVCVLLWLNGCKSLYDRIVHGDQDVIIEEGSA